MERVAWLGTGLLGSGFVEGLLSRGVTTVDVWNRTAAKTEPLQKKGANAHANVADAVKNAQRVHLCLNDDAAVDAVLAQAIPALGKDAVVVDHTTALPENVARRSEKLAAQKIAFIHAPVFMAPDNARNATGIIMVSGADDVVTRVKPALEKMSGKLMMMGTRPDKAAAFKLFGNCMIIAMTAGMADMFVMARATGLEPSDALELFKDFQVGGQFTGRGARMARGDFNASFEMSMARKDVRLMIETARAAPQLPLTMLPAVAERMDALIAAGHAEKDLGALALDVFGSVVNTGRRKAP